MGYWKAAAAALAMVLGAGQAEAVRWVAYSVSGTGTATDFDLDSRTSRSYDAAFSALVVVDLDPTVGGEPYTSTGSSFYYSAFYTTSSATKTATFDPAYLVAAQYVGTEVYRTVFDLRSGGPVNFQQSSYLIAGTPRAGTTFVGSATYLDVRNAGSSVVPQIPWTFSLAVSVPEPATWATLLLGFGAIGIGARRRRAHYAAA